MVSADRNFSVEVRMYPITISAKAVTAGNMNAMFVTAVFFGHPEVRNALKFGNLPLNQIAIKFRLGLSPTGAAISVIEATLKKKSIEGFIHEKLTSGLAVIESFGLVRVRSSENDKGHVVASVAGAPAVVFAIDDVEGVAGSQSRAAIIPFGI